MSFFAKQHVTVEIEGRVEWQVARDPQDGHWFGVCAALNINAAGDSWGEFQECANDSIALLFKALFTTGELQGFLSRHGWRSAQPLPVAGTRVKFEMPFGIELMDRVQEFARAGQ